MRNFLIYVFPAIFALHVGAQVNFQPVGDRFLLFYNQQKSDSIFMMYSSEEQKNLSLEKNRTVIEGLHVEFGDLKTLTVIKQDTGYAQFKARFQDQILTLVLALNNEGLIEGLRFIPFTQKSTDGDKNGK